MLARNQKLIKMLLILSLSWKINSSYTRVEQIIDGVKVVNPCSTEALGSIIPSIDQNSSRLGGLSEPKIQAICPFLKYSCCNLDELNYLVKEFQATLAYLKYRIQVIIGLFFKIQEIAHETFDVFLNELTDDDKKCYNEVIHNRMERFTKKYEDYPEVVKSVRERLKLSNYDYKNTTETFLYLKTNISNFINDLKDEQTEREKYYTGFACSICSPYFSKFINKSKDDYILKINKFMCKKKIQDQYLVYKNVGLYKYIQSVIDLSYCVRNNSKKELNYKNVSPENLLLLTIPVEFFNLRMKLRKKCMNDPELFITQKLEEGTCPQLCKDNLTMFDRDMISFDKLVMAENEIENMFFRDPDSKTTPNENLQKKMDKLNSIRKYYIDEGYVTLDQENERENLIIIKEKKGSDLVFKDAKIEIDNFFGLNVYHTSMNPEYYEFSQIFKICGLLIMLLFIKI
jgi:hypothetical protein